MSIVVTLHGCVDGVVKPPRCAHPAKGRRVLRRAPKFPCPFPNAAELSIVCRKGRRVCPPLGSHVTIVPQGAHAHAHSRSSFPPVLFPLVLFVRSLIEYAQAMHVVGGCHRRPYNSDYEQETKSIP